MANPNSFLNVLNGTETTQPLLLGAGTTLNGQPIPGSGATIVNSTATVIALTAAANANKTLVLDAAAASAITLPAATGTGNAYVVFIDTAATATASTISTVASGEVFKGICWAATTAANAVLGYVATATDNTISLNGTTKGGVKGDRIVMVDVKASTWSVEMYTAPTGTTTTPFSHV